MQRLAYVAAFLAAWFLSPALLRAAGGQITVAAASDTSFAMNDLAAGFEKASGTSVKISTGSSGNFFTQIQNGAPFDAFFSADIDYPRQLEAANLTEPQTLYVYAAGKIVLWVRNDSPLDIGKGWDALLDPRVRKIAIANPEHAPYGRTAVAALRMAGMYDRVSARLVLGENISQAAEFVDSGNADIGILAYSLTVSPTMKDRGRAWLVPENQYPRLDQAAVILGSSKNKDAAHAFLSYVKSPEGQAILKRYGFVLPVPAAARP